MSPIQSQASMDGACAQPARILIVEDERIVASDLASALAELGYCVPETVATGEDAIARARELQPDLVLMDVRLPGEIDGVRAAASVRDEHDIPVIFLTAHSDDETLRRAMHSGPSGYLVKPFSPPQLRCAIEIALHRRQTNGRIADLEAANQELERFTYGVAHDLRGPLRGIDGLSQSLIEGFAGSLGPEGLRTLRQVRETAGRVRQVIDDLLMLSIDDLLVMSGVRKAEPRRDAVDLSRIATDVLEAQRESAPERTVKTLVEQGVLVEGDGALLRIALEHLLANAWKYTAGVEHARIEFGAIHRDGQRICFVRDNGAGFDTRHVNSILAAFEHLGSARSCNGQGPGLAVVQRVIDKHGGRIWAEGAVGRGATFYFAI